MKVREIMSQPAVTVREDAPLPEVARLLLDRSIGCVPVVDGDGRLVGIITESDFAAKEKSVPFSTFRAPQLLRRWMGQEGVEKIYQAAQQMKAEEIMRRKVFTVAEDQSVDEAVAALLKHDVNRLPVVRDGRPVGVIARHDLLRLMARG